MVGIANDKHPLMLNLLYEVDAFNLRLVCIALPANVFRRAVHAADWLSIFHQHVLVGGRVSSEEICIHWEQ